MRIEIKGATLPSWNMFYSGRHWSVRSKFAHDWHMLVKNAAKRFKITDSKVDIKVECFYSGRAIDSDNLCLKLITDGLKGIVIKDDTPRYVHAVTAISSKDKSNPRTIINITKCNE